MPRLNYPKITKTDAINALMAVYREDAAFMDELQALRQPYEELLLRAAIDMMGYCARSGASPDQYYRDPSLASNPGGRTFLHDQYKRKE